MREKQEIASNLDLSKRDLPEPLSQRKKVALAILFIIGIPLSYPTVLPLGVLCAAILIFQKNRKARIVGYVLILFQLLLLIGMMIVWNLI